MTASTPRRLDGKKTAVRQPDGKFTEGNPGGPGRPRRATEHAYLLATLNACPLEAWQEIVTAAVQSAKDGDYRAREWLSSYLIGEPKGPAPTPLNALADDESGIDTVGKRAAKHREEAIFSQSFDPASSVADILRGY